MNIKKLALILSLSFLMVSSLSLVNDKTYAYWATNIDVPSIANSVGTINVGAWYPAWDPNATYLLGDRVEHNGNVYEAKKDNPTKEPGVDSGWQSSWVLIEPA